MTGASYRADRRGNIWLAVVIALVLAAWWVAAAEADGPGTAAIAFVPADGNSLGIELHSQTVDAVIGQSEGAAWADTAVWVRLRNPAPRPVTVTIQVPGPQLSPVPLPQDLAIQLNEKPFDMQPVEPEDPELGPQMAGQVVIPARKAISLRATYSQTLAVTDGLASFAYFLTAADEWANTPESLRVTLEFDPAIFPDQMLAEAPPAHRRGPDRLTWDWERERALANVGVAFMTSRWWDEFREIRAAAGGPDADAAAALALGRAYRHLATLAAPPFAADEALWKRFYPAMIAAFQSAATSPDATREEIVAAQIALAETYMAQANRLPAGESGAHLQLAANAAEAAKALGAEDAGLIALAETAYERLALIAAAEGDLARQAAYQARRAALTNSPAETEDQTAARLSQAARAAQRGEIKTAREMVIAALGADVLAVPGATQPRARQAVVNVTTRTGQRDVSLTLIDAGRPGTVRDLLAQASIALSGVAGVTVSRVGNTLTLTLRFQDGAELVTAGGAAAAALPHDPELALLAAALTPDHVTWRAREGMLTRSTNYLEHVDLGPAGLVWAEQANRLAAAARSLPGSTEEQADPSLMAVQRAIWTGDAATWRGLAEQSFSIYRAEIEPGAPGRSWLIPVAEARVLSSTATHWITSRALGIGAAALILLLLLIALLRRWG